MAAAWLDEREPDLLFVARGIGRPLWIGEGGHELVFASTREALELAERYAGLELAKRELGEGTLLAVSGGRAVRTESFDPTAGHGEKRPLTRARVSRTWTPA